MLQSICSRRCASIIKISKSVCVSGYAFRHASRYGAETWHGGTGRAHEVCGHIFETTPPGVKGHLRVNLLKMPNGYQIW